MLALRRHSRQVVVTNEKFNGPDMVGERLGKGQRVADQPGNALAQCVALPESPSHIRHIDLDKTWRADGRLAGSWPTGARHSCGCDPPHERPRSGGSWHPWRSTPTAYWLSSAPSWPVHRLPPQAVGSAHRGYRRRVGYADDPVR